MEEVAAAAPQPQVRIRWSSLVHRGVAFPPEHQPRGITISIMGEKIALNTDQEELVYAWAKKKDTHYVQDPVFQSNFLLDLKPMLPEKFRKMDLKISDFDFSQAYRLADEEKAIKEREKERIKNLPREEKKKMAEAKKAERERLKALYGKAIVDGQEVDIANWLVEPPGLFMGRGQHPLRGRWKPRVRPQDVTLNLGEDAPVPEGEWKEIVHDHTSTWLATWMENLTEKRKYVWLHDSSELRQGNDKAKYDKALKLAQQLGKVEKEIMRKMKGSNDRAATAAYLIFKLAMRVGDEKDPDEADTVGASTLRVEHIKFPQANGKQYIEFNFLGKDSVPWQKTLEVNSDDTRALYDNLRSFMKDKKPDQQIFDDINSRKVNAFFQTVMPGLTAKVFRTCIATKVVQQALVNPPIKVDRNSQESDKVYVAKSANLKAAIECNHKKGVDPKNPAAKKAAEKFEESIAKRKEAIAELEKQVTAANWKTEIQEKRLKERLAKLKMQLKLQQETRDYNLGTSLRNYIDPRVMRAWLNYVELDWTKVYTATLQRKFKWVEGYKEKNYARFYP
ncbi:topoisomerase IB [Candidatus Nitrososphaera evergladensis SR1]|jgi:DNA topoisomerase-1|uniref:DNA topoisomerase 1 n=1 Tax=Candidatus Nitrososphaera evergladensis SR1 TaxID=1459636 RepID=A0A075MUX1_9ARCH|nr:DNA topoisomerase I [Candidatus Nitrososphaera evergladensis]AIF84963.1 topoisomerase IB [Candidatus Nitrososphaera evergladensis SR1]